jgi:hypothetical protein
MDVELHPLRFDEDLVLKGQRPVSALHGWQILEIGIEFTYSALTIWTLRRPNAPSQIKKCLCGAHVA